MASLKDRVAGRIGALREDRPALDHAVRAVTYYTERNGNGQAGAVTYYAFLSFFPLLALAFFVVGYVSAVYPDAREALVDAINAIVPGLVGNGKGQIPLRTFEQYGATVGLVGVLGLLYSGLAWIAAMRRSLAAMFHLHHHDQLPFVRGRLRDLLALVVLGLVLVVSVSLSGTMSWFSESVFRALGLDQRPAVEALLWLVSHGLAIGATTLLFMAVYGLVPRRNVARRALWQGAVAGAVGFEVLKSLAGFLISLTRDRPAFQVFGVSLILLVWINYFSRLIMLSAAWAYTAAVAEEVRALNQEPLVTAEETDLVEPAPASVVAEDAEDPRAGVPAARGAPQRAPDGSGGWVVAALTKLRRRAHR